MTRGYHHGSTSNGLAMFWNLGKESGVWDTEIRTDMEWVTKKDNYRGEGHSLPFFDAIVLVNCTGNWNLDDEQKQALLSFVREDGKGLVVAHASLDANYDWPEYAEMVGGWFQAHPWGTFDAPVIVEDQTFPATQHFPKYLRLFDEMYSPKQWSRDQVNVLMRMDETQARLREAAVRHQEHAPGQGPGDRVGQDVRERPRVLLQPRTHEGGLGGPDGPHALPRGREVGAREDRRQHEASPEGELRSVLGGGVEWKTDGRS